MSYELGGENAVPFSAHGADYIIRKSGSVYLAEGRLGNQDLHDTSLVDLWDAIYGEVASPTMVFTRGNYTVDDTLSIQAEETKVLGVGIGATVFTAQNALNADMFDWEGNNFYWDVTFQDLRIEGNSTNQVGASQRGIECEIAVATLPGDETYMGVVNLDNIHIRDCNGAGFWWKTTSGLNTVMRVTHSKIVGNGDGAAETVDFIVERCFDAYITDNSFSAGRLLKAVTNCHFSDNYWGGGGEEKQVEFSGSTVANPAKGNMFSNEFFDNPNNDTAADSACFSGEDYFRENVLSGCAFGRNNTNSTANIAPQIQLIDNATRNAVLACFWYHPNAVTRTFKYAIEEKGSADYNMYSGTICKNDPFGDPIYGTGYWSVAGNSDVRGLKVI